MMDSPYPPQSRRLALSSFEYPALTAASILACAIALGGFSTPLSNGLIAFGIMLLCIWIVWQDVTTFTISDAAILSFGALAAGSRFSQASVAALSMHEVALPLSLDILAPGGFMFLIREYFFRSKGYDGLGFGDVKLSLAAGLLAGATGFFWALFFASLLLLTYSLAQMVWARSFKARDKLPLGAALAPATLVVWGLTQWWFLSSPGQL